MGGRPIFTARLFCEDAVMLNPDQAPGTRVKLLLVEDSKPMQEILTEIIQTMAGVELVGVAKTASGAMAAFGVHRPEVIVLDLGLRAGNGLDVLKQVKRRAPACQVLVFTNNDTEPYRDHCLAAGADRFFSKTQQYQELLEFLRKLGGAEPADSFRKSRRP